MKKVIVIGNGFIASHLPYEIANKVRLPANDEEMYRIIYQLKADVIVNATGFCGKPNVDECETKKSQTYMTNVTIPSLLAETCERQGIQMVHLGSGCIYFGKSPHAISKLIPAEDEAFFPDEVNPFQPYKPDWIDSGWQETDFANPESYYSKTKYACDLILGQMKNVVTLRLRMPISPLNNSRNLMNKLLNYKMVLEEPNSVTFTDDLVAAIDWAIENEKSGIYHVASPEPLTHSMLLEEYRKYVPEHTYTKITKEKLDGMVAAKRSNCILDCSKIVNEGFKFEETRARVRETIKNYVRNTGK